MEYNVPSISQKNRQKKPAVVTIAVVTERLPSVQEAKEDNYFFLLSLQMLPSAQLTLTKSGLCGGQGL